MMEKTQKYENTYITGPEGYGEGQKFSRGVVKNVIQKIINDKLTGMAYDNTKASQVGKELSDMIKEKVKTMGFPRYKLIVQVRVQYASSPTRASHSPPQFRSPHGALDVNDTRGKPTQEQRWRSVELSTMGK